MKPSELALIILGLNMVAFACMWLDKQLAKRGAWRIPEANLFALAVLGGAWGMWAGMKCFRHKTAKRAFYLRIIAIMLLQPVALIAYWLGTH